LHDRSASFDKLRIRESFGGRKLLLILSLSKDASALIPVIAETSRNQGQHNDEEVSHDEGR